MNNTQYGGASTSFFMIIVYISAMALAGYYSWKHFDDGKRSTAVRAGISIACVLGAFLVVYLLNMLTLSI